MLIALIFILDDNSCKLPFKMLPAANTHYCCIITGVILSQITQLTMGQVLVYIQSLESCTVQVISRCLKPIPHFFQMYACPFLQG